MKGKACLLKQNSCLVGKLSLTVDIHSREFLGTENVEEQVESPVETIFYINYLAVP